jgi:hypothetical protein
MAMASLPDRPLSHTQPDSAVSKATKVSVAWLAMASLPDLSLSHTHNLTEQGYNLTQPQSASLQSPRRLACSLDMELEIRNKQDYSFHGARVQRI